MALLVAKGVVKRFPGVVALSEVDFTLNPGEIHALVGENGAGKSTLIKIFSGVLRADFGELFYLGDKVSFASPTEALAKGIVTVHQELNLFDNLTVAENLFVGDANSTFIRRKTLVKRAQAILDELHFPIDASRPVASLSASEKQLLLIAKALERKAKVLILDEPTAAITRQEASELFGILKRLKERDVGIIFISHRLEEIFEVADRVSILRDGKLVASKSISELTRDDVIRFMVGRSISEMYPKYNRPSEEVLFEVVGLSVSKVLSDVTFNVRKGEIFGITGLVGSGANLVPLAIYGALRGKWKKLTLSGVSYERIRDPHHALELGIAVVPEERKQLGLFLGLDVRKNICIQDLNGVSRRFVLDWRRINDEANIYVSRFSIKTPSLRQLVKNLSGGNQQKVLVSKVLRCKPRLVFLVEPTRGIDVGAKVDVYKLVNDLANDGIGTVLVSTELPEIVKLCDRVLVMHRGHPAGILEGNEISQENIMKLATGG